MTSAVMPSTGSAYGIVPRAGVFADLRDVAFAHLGVAVALISLATAIEPVTHPRDTAWVGLPLLAVSVGCVVAIWRCLSSALPVALSLVGLLGFGAAAFLAGATSVWVRAAGASRPITLAVAGLVGGALAALLQWRRPATGTVLACGLGAIAVAVGLVGDRGGADRAAVAAALLIVAVPFAAGALTGWLAPAVPAAFVSLVAGGAAAIVMVAGDVEVQTRVLALLVLLLTVVATAPVGSPVLVTLMIPIVGATVALAGWWSQLSNWPAVGVVVGGLVGLVAAYSAERRSRVPLRMGFPYALATALVAFGSLDLAQSGSDGGLVLAIAADLVLLGVSVALRRVFVLAVAVAALSMLAPDHFAQSSATARHLSEALLAVVGLVVAVGSARSRRQLLVRSADVGRGDLPPGDAESATLPASYDDVFDALLPALAVAGPLLLADRATGRLLAGPVTVATWRLAGDSATSLRVWGPAEARQSVTAAVAGALARS
jgi:hypothetical protein